MKNLLEIYKMHFIYIIIVVRVAQLRHSRCNTFSFLLFMHSQKCFQCCELQKKKGLNCNIELVPKSRLNASCSFGSALIKMGRGGIGKWRCKRVRRGSGYCSGYVNLAKWGRWPEESTVTRKWKHHMQVAGHLESNFLGSSRVGSSRVRSSW